MDYFFDGMLISSCMSLKRFMERAVGKGKVPTVEEHMIQRNMSSYHKSKRKH